MSEAIRKEIMAAAAACVRGGNEYTEYFFGACTSHCMNTEAIREFLI